MTQPRRRASENQRALQEAIKELIVRRGLAPGSLLPTETELMAELSVSRHPLREAIKALQALGIVDIRHGLGTYVGTPSFSPLEAGLTFLSHLSLRGDLRDSRDLRHRSDPHDSRDPRHRSDLRDTRDPRDRGDLRDIDNLVQIREALETGLVRQVLALAGDADFDTLEGAVATMERAATEGRYSPEADWLFHRTLYAPLRNELISDLLRVFWSVLDKVNAELPRTAETPRVAAAAHRDILDTLRDGDAQMLTAAVAGHFDDIRERISRVPRL